MSGGEVPPGRGGARRLDPIAGDREVDRIVVSQSESHRVRRRPQSLRQEYEEFILQRIEEYKEQLSRGELLSLGDEAVRELEAGPRGQLVLTEVLMLDHVDRLIKKRLRLPAFRRWSEKHRKLRRAQQEPTHWGLPAETPLRDLAHGLKDGDVALVVGTRAAPAGLLLAAYDVDVLLIDQDLAAVEAIETRVASEALSAHFQALVISIGGWFPDVHPGLVVADPELIESLDQATALQVVGFLKERTAPGGAHLILPLPPAVDGARAAARKWSQHYEGWVKEGSARLGRPNWLLARRPNPSSASS